MILLSSRNSVIRAVFLIFVLFVLFRSLYIFYSSPTFGRLLPNPSGGGSESNSENNIASNIAPEPPRYTPPSLPSIYTAPHSNPPDCERKYGLEYLYDAATSNRPYCDATNSASQISCFRSNMAQNRLDPSCIVSQVILPPGSSNFEIDCQMRNFDTAEDLKGAPQIQSFKQDWYDTGPGYIFNNFITIGKDHTKEISECQNPNSASHTILIKREGAFNLWHSLMEIFSYTLTLDIFTLSSNNPTGVPFFNQPYDAETSQVLILDDGDEGPYFELWHLLAKRPILRMSDLQTSNTTCIKNLVVPLSGATNPMWQGDWIPLDCTESKMLLVFIDRVLTHLSITPQRDPSAKLVLTYIDRKSSRKLENQALLLDDLKTTYPDITINIVDFAALSFREQVETVATTDILVGVHGAGLTHSMWLPPHSAVVEILPEKVGHKGFRNLAKLRGHQYFSTHGSPTQDDGTDWHYKSVVIEAPRFLDLVGTAIKTMYHKGLLDQDILKR